MTGLDVPLERLQSYPDELPPPRRRGDVDPVGLLSIADDLALGLSALRSLMGPSGHSIPPVPSGEDCEHVMREVDRLLRRAVHLQRNAHAALLGRCLLGSGSPRGCSTEGAVLRLNVWDDTSRRAVVEDGTAGCVAHTVEAVRRVMRDPVSRKVLLVNDYDYDHDHDHDQECARDRDREGPAVARGVGLGPDDTEVFLSRGLTLRPDHRAA
ncbi:MULTISPECIES: hypothetical protein [Streptomyces]|uniref:Uncharacterized protein n=1 Tax=Streptomyces violaceolatus TaxID=67378 RepID=A0ABN3TBJ9_9ACTN|nr:MULTISPECIES: hypothetical protein [Streptomyces]MDX3349446.1 hypothetical protein [Streptomyces sp. ME02-6979A]